MASISSINPTASNLSDLEQSQNPSSNIKQSDSTTSNSSIGSIRQASLDNSDSDKPSFLTNTNNQVLPSVKDNKSLTKDSQLTTSFQKSQLLSNFPNNDSVQDTAKPSNNTSTVNSSTVKETSVANSSKELGDYGHLSTGQKKLVDDLANRQNAANKTQLSPSEVYNSLEPSQKSTFESITNALENTTIIGKDGTKTNALDTIERVDVILGENKGKDGTQQFRLLVSLKDGAGSNIRTAKNFGNVPGHGEEFKHGRQLSGGEPSIQISVSPDGKKADIDVDYESKNAVVNVFNGFKHLKASNSDVRHADHFEKHNKRFASEPGQQPLVKKY
ncbi:MAG: Uncharacterized protein FD167_2377 [bacterium]|nr:MAG: Uncharacterized protein FD167_2377 [bacterium]